MVDKVFQQNDTESRERGKAKCENISQHYTTGTLDAGSALSFNIATVSIDKISVLYILDYNSGDVYHVILGKVIFG